MTEGGRPEDDKLSLVLSKNGGSAFGETFDSDEIVAMTKYGEVAFYMNEQGDLGIEFGEIGFSVLYDDQGDIQFATFDVEGYLRSVSQQDIEGLPDKGRGLKKIMDRLDINEKQIKIAMFPELSRIETAIFTDEIGSKGEMVTFDNVDFKKGFLGKLKFEGIEIGFEFTNLGIDYGFSLGKVDGDKLPMVAIEFSGQLDFEEDFFSDSYNRYQRLAQKVLIR